MALRSKDIAIRAMSALVLAPAALLAIWAGGRWFLGLMILASIVLSVEWARMSEARSWKLMATTVSVGVILALVATYMDRLSLALVMLVVAAACAALFARLRRQDALNAAYGMLYLGWPAILLVWLREQPDPYGLAWTVLAFVVAWSSDVVAYLAGSMIGGPKLWPRFSPNKTWAGFFGGVVAGTVAGAAMAAFFDMGSLTPIWGALLGFFAALATMAGDLWESALKRRFGVKDAGDLIPGHGGLLDRVDGLMFAVVVVAIGRMMVILIERAA
jgi:CDP-diglyceride synthetase